MDINNVVTADCVEGRTGDQTSSPTVHYVNGYSGNRNNVATDSASTDTLERSRNASESNSAVESSRVPFCVRFLNTINHHNLYNDITTYVISHATNSSHRPQP